MQIILAIKVAATLSKKCGGCHFTFLKAYHRKGLYATLPTGPLS